MKAADTVYKKSAARPRMTNYERAAQFASFAALDGHSDSVCETARLTEYEEELSEDRLFELSVKMRILSDHISLRPETEITYFVPDERKTGGRYDTAKGNLRAIDEYDRELILEDGKRIPMDRIVSLRGGILDFEEII